MKTSDYVWPHLAELPTFRALIRSIEHRLLTEHKPFAVPILDVGVGDGHFASVSLGPSIDVGIDVDIVLMDRASKRGIYRQLLGASATELPFPNDHFATVISNCVIEHIPNLQATLSEMYRTLRPGGHLLITVPTNQLETNLLVPRLMRSVGLNSLATRYLRWFRTMQVHYHLLSREEWNKALEDVGFTVIQQRRYMSAWATLFFELGHYFGWHNVVARRLTGRWVVWVWRPRFFLTEHMLASFVDEPEHADDSCLFVLASK